MTEAASRSLGRATGARMAWGYGLATVSEAGERAGHLVSRARARPAPATRPRAVPPRWPPGARSARGVRTDVGPHRDRPGRAARRRADAYLRLHLLSHRLVRPHGINLDGIFGVLPNVVWTDAGPVPGRRTSSGPGCALRAAAGRLQVFGVDKFPRMTDYVVPSGVRIADADRVRLGAHLAPGHHGHARGLRQLQRRHARRLHGRGPDLAGRGRRRRLGHRRRRVDHGHAVRRRHAGRLDRRAVPDRRQRRHRHLPRRRLRRRGRAATSPPGTKARPCPTDRVGEGAQSCPARAGLLFWRNSVTGAVEAGARGTGAVALNAALHANA